MNLVKYVVVAALLTILAASVPAQVCNLKVVTDANPDYSDMASMVRSITAKWDAPKDKMWALFYWNHIARRQTHPMWVHGIECVDPIRQYNDYGYTMCSTVSGVNCSTWDFMGMASKYYEIGLHTVCEVLYDERYHLYDSSLSAIYTLCDGKTIAGVEDVGAEGACEASGGKVELGHIAKYHCLTATSVDGFLTGCDCSRTVASEAKSFNPKVVKHQYFYKCAEYGHRYILNLREGEVYSRYYHRLDADSPNAVQQSDKPNAQNFRADPAYFVPREFPGKDLESANPRYRIRGNGLRTWAPPLTAGALAKVAYSIAGAAAIEPAGVAPVESGKGGEVVFKVEGANVIASMKINAALVRRTAADSAAISVSADGGLTWKEVFQADATGDVAAGVNLIGEVNGAYDVLVKVALMGKAAPADAALKGISFETITQVNSKTQPRLNLGANAVYVGAGDQTESIVVWPDLREGKYGQYVKEQKNLVSVSKADYGRYALMYIEDAAVPKGWVIFKVDSPTDITSVTYGGRMCVRAPKSYIELSHSFDDGKTWTPSYTLNTTGAPWDTTHYETIDKAPAGARSVLFKYYLWSNEGTPAMCGLYSVRMEVNHKVADGAFKPTEITFNWNERQADYNVVPRSHTQLVDKVPFRYNINVGGADHPVMESLTVNLKGARPSVLRSAVASQAAATQPVEVKYGYSDGKDNAGAARWVGRWATYGKNHALNKPYTSTVQSATNWSAGDPDGKRLTDGVVAAPYSGGTTYSFGVLWPGKSEPIVTVDLGKSEKCGAFRIQLSGYPMWDAIKGEIKDKVEVLTSNDDKEYASQGFFNFNLYWKDIPVNHVWTDEETFASHNHCLILPRPVDARYVRFKVTPARGLACSEVQVLDQIKLEPFDLRLALPDDKVVAKPAAAASAPGK